MNISRTKLNSAITIILVTLSLNMPAFALGAGGNHLSESSTAVAPAIRVAPPAPVIDPDERRAELFARRARVAEKIGPGGVLVLFSGEPRVYANDVYYEFRQENNLYYLTNLRQKGATLVMMPGNTQMREILFLPKRSASLETWTGRMYSPEEASQISGINEIYEAREFEPFMRGLRDRRAYRPKDDALLLSAQSQARSAATPVTPLVTPPVPKAAQPVEAAAASVPPVSSASGVAVPNLATTNATSAQAPGQTPVPPPAAVASTSPTGYEALFAAAQRNEASLFLLTPPGEAESREYKQEQRYAAQWGPGPSGYTVRSAFPIFAELRMRKSPLELRLLQHAIDITTEGFGRAMGAIGRAQWEYEVEAEIDYTFKRRNADNWGYPSIVGCGPNATTLHYETSQGRVAPGDLLLMDVGAEYDHYTADVTRTYPANGKFTPAQADIYNVVLAAQEAGMRASRAGAKIPDVHKAALEVVKDGLLRLGLITDRNSRQYLLWFMHGTSHYLGMNVHDVGVPGAKLEPGMVYTIEPGIYIREDALDNLAKTPENERLIGAIRPAFEKYKNIGVRIEDDVLITGDGYRNMSGALPRTILEIEAFMAQAARELVASRIKSQPNQSAARWLVSSIENDQRWLQPNRQAHEFARRSFSPGAYLDEDVVGHVFVGNAGKFFRDGHKH